MSRTSSRHQDFKSGVTFWFQGWRFLFANRSLLTVAIIPFLISLSFTVLLIGVLWKYLPLWVQNLINTWIGLSAGLWHDFLYYPLVVGGGILVFISSIYVMYIVQMVVAVPFYTLLADRTLWRLAKKPEESKAWKKWARKTLSMIKASLLKAALLLSIGIILFMFSFLPVLNIFALWGALLILGFDCMDYSFEAMGFGFRRRLAYLFREWAQWSGMAVGLALTLLIPGLTLLVLPGAVVGAALILKKPSER